MREVMPSPLLVSVSLVPVFSESGLSAALLRLLAEMVREWVTFSGLFLG